MSSCGLTGLVIAQRPAQELQRAVGQHLVDVHVGRGARPALQGIDDDMLVQPAVDHLLQAVSMAANFASSHQPSSWLVRAAASFTAP